MTKRRSRGEGSLFQRADGMWVGRINLGYRDGKPRRPTVYASSKTACQTKLNDLKKAAAQGDTSTRRMRLDAWLRYWLEEVCAVKTTIKPQTLRTYRTYVTEYLIPAIGTVRLDQIEARHLRELHRYMRNRDLSETTVGHAHRILGTALADAMRDNLLFRNPVSLVQKPTNARSRRRSLSLVEVQSFLTVIHEARNDSRWHAALLLGMRQGECLGLQRHMVDLEKGVVDVSTQLQRVPWAHGCSAGKCGYAAQGCPSRKLATTPGFEFTQLQGNLCLVRPKTEGSERSIPLPDQMLWSFSRHLADTAHETNPHGLMWTTAGGAPIEATDDRVEWHRILKAAGISDTDQHSARHTTSTLLLELGVPEEIRMAILGHSQVATTRNYSHQETELQRSALATLGDRLQL